MSIDTSPLGILSATVMEQISERFGSDAILRTAAVVIEIETEDASEILVASSDHRSWVQLAFLKEGQITLERQLEDLERLEDE